MDRIPPTTMTLCATVPIPVAPPFTPFLPLADELAESDPLPRALVAELAGRLGLDSSGEARSARLFDWVRFLGTLTDRAEAGEELPSEDKARLRAGRRVIYRRDGARRTLGGAWIAAANAVLRKRPPTEPPIQAIPASEAPRRRMQPWVRTPAPRAPVATGPIVEYVRPRRPGRP